MPCQIFLFYRFIDELKIQMNITKNSMPFMMHVNFRYKNEGLLSGFGIIR